MQIWRRFIRNSIHSFPNWVDKLTSSMQILFFSMKIIRSTKFNAIQERVHTIYPYFKKSLEILVGSMRGDLWDFKGSLDRLDYITYVVAVYRSKLHWRSTNVPSFLWNCFFSRSITPSSLPVRALNYICPNRIASLLFQTKNVCAG